MKSSTLLAAVLLVSTIQAQAQTKYGRGTGYRTARNSDSPAANNSAAPAKVQAQPQPAKAFGATPQKPATIQSFNSRVRREDGGGEPAGPQPVAGALIRTAGVGTKFEPSANSGYLHFGHMGGWKGEESNTIAAGGAPLDHGNGGVRMGRPDNQSGTAGGNTNTFNQYKSWTDQIK